MDVSTQSATGCENPPDTEVRNARRLSLSEEGHELEVGLLTGGVDRHYAFGLAMSLALKGVRLDFVGTDAVDSPELHSSLGVTFLNLRGNRRPDAGILEKIFGLLAYYARLIRYAAGSRPKAFHILWNNKFELFDRTVLMLYYKLAGKKIALTAHNVNEGTRDSNDSVLNRLTLGIQYRLADHIFVHTEKMKTELVAEFRIPESTVTVIPYGLNNAVPETQLTPEEAKQRLGIKAGERTIMFFGNIAPYKGVEYLVAAFQQILTWNRGYRLMIVGRVKKGCENYWKQIQQMFADDDSRERMILKIGFIPDEEVELYFKAADVLALPYKHIFQSGVLFLGYRFGLPLIAADVGSLREEIIEGETGFLFRPGDAMHLAETIETYFASSLYQELASRRQQIRDYAEQRHSWDGVAQMTRDVYAQLLAH